jgi:hypothetical protein
VAPTALPFDIKSATVGEGQTPVTLSSVDDGLGDELRVLLAHSMRNGHQAQEWGTTGSRGALDPDGLIAFLVSDGSRMSGSR